jgi:RND family efflux transporter MFP subunit
VTAILFALIAAGMAFVPACREQPPSARAAAEQNQPIPVRVAPVQRRPVQRGIDVTGTLFGEDETAVAAKAAGRVVAVLKDLGDHAAPGEPLAEVDRTDYELTRLQRAAAVSESLARLGLDEMPGDDFDLSTLPAVRRAQAEQTNARSRLERGRQLFENDPPLISEQEHLDLQTAVEIATRNVSVEMLLGKALLATARSRAADLAVAEQALRDTEIRAPAPSANGAPSDVAADYLVAERLISIGEYVDAGQAVFTLIDVDPIKFRADVPERYAGAVQTGQRVSVHIEAFSHGFSGALRRISPRVDPGSRTFLIEAEIPNTDGRLKPGNFALGRIDTTLEPGVTFVPASAVVSFAGVKRIFSVSDGKAIEHRIQTGVEVDGVVEIIGGALTTDTLVIVEGATKVSSGAPVTVQPPSSTSAGAAVSDANAS